MASESLVVELGFRGGGGLHLEDLVSEFWAGFRNKDWGGKVSASGNVDQRSLVWTFVRLEWKKCMLVIGLKRLLLEETKL